ncbi:hypothetical protein [Hydrotalea sp.]|uniref:hypothetical protein n=1 Tax=Hydrotalea sp. TaxID=2881279 RepID=UPI002633F46A|nr:hypothetical protein [Hydrotalea sp.]
MQSIKIFFIRQGSSQESLVVLVVDKGQLLQHLAAVDLSVFNFLVQQQKPATVIYHGTIGFADK